MKIILEQIKYKQHKWQVSEDLKILTMLLGQQSENMKYSCFLSLWDSRDRSYHYKKKICRKKMSLGRGRRNVNNDLLVELSNVLLPPLHIKLENGRQFQKIEMFNEFKATYHGFSCWLLSWTPWGLQWRTGRKVPPRYQSYGTKI